MTFSEPIRLVIWDLDETFWRGTLEEGPVTVPSEHAEIIKSLARRGIVSAIASRNDHAAVKARLEECGIWEWFVFPRIAYTFKSELVSDIVVQIGLRPGTVLFIDDNPFNRADVAERVAGINVVDPSIVPELLAHPQLQGKPDAQLTRLMHYRVLESKQAASSTATDRSAFLRSCEIVVSVHFDVENHFERIHDLVNRTNQLNFTKLRWPEDEECARKEYFNQKRKTHAGYVKVRDRYGYYGICGFFETRRRARGIFLEHFLFSCRVLDMGVEQFVYQHLDFPKLNNKPDAVTQLSGSHIVDWIALVMDAEQESAAPARKPGVTLCVHGPCDLLQTAHYLRSHFATIEEFHYPRHGWQIMRPLLRNVVLKDELEQRGVASCADLGLPDNFPGIDFSALGSTFLDGSAGLCVWSFSMQSHEALYRHRATGLVFPLAIRHGSANMEDITALAFADICDNGKIKRRDFRAMRDSFECVGFMDQTQFVADLRALRQKLLALGKPFLIVEAFDDLAKIDAPAYRRHGIINKLVRDELAGLDNVYFIRFSDCVSDDGDQVGENHFVRGPYMNLASRILELVSSISEAAQDRRLPKENPCHAQATMNNGTKIEDAQRSALSQLPKKHLKPILKGTMRYTWRGVMCNKSPFDLALYPLLIWQQKPRTIIEFGTRQGGSALWFHDICRAFGLDTRIISVDIQQRAKFEVEGISFISGNALHPEQALPDELMDALPRPLLVSDDSAHTPSTVLAILRFMDAHLRVGEYIVIEDGIFQSMHMDKRFEGGPGPAIAQFLAERSGSFAIDTSFCDFFGPNVTFNTDGYLVKVAP